MGGMIYFIQCGKDGPIKIGTVGGHNASAIGSRLSSIQGSTHLRLRILGYFPGGRKNEIALHKKMRQFRLCGEWFLPEKELIELINKQSIMSEQEGTLYEETISVDELVKLLQDEFAWDAYYKNIIRFVINDKKIPSRKVFGRKRYKYEEVREYLSKEYGGLKLVEPVGGALVFRPSKEAI
jgi:hypothetical protein